MLSDQSTFPSEPEQGFAEVRPIHERLSLPYDTSLLFYITTVSTEVLNADSRGTGKVPSVPK